MRHRLRVQEPGDRGPAGECGRAGDHEDDDDAGQILGPAEPIGVRPRRRSPADDERDAQRDGGQRVGDVVQGVAEQRDRAGDQHDHHLDGRGGTEHGQRDPQGTQTLAGRLHRRVDLVGRVVRVRSQRVPDPVLESTPATAVVVVVFVFVRPMLVAGGRSVFVPVLIGGGTQVRTRVA
jgi:hypothetical protein